MAQFQVHKGAVRGSEPPVPSCVLNNAIIYIVAGAGGRSASSSWAGPRQASCQPAMAAASVALEAFASAAAGGLGSVVSKLFTYPLDFLKVKLSVKDKEETAASIIGGVMKQHGVTGLYKGIS